jgi:hypothetical protein
MVPTVIVNARLKSWTAETHLLANCEALLQLVGRGLQRHRDPRCPCRCKFFRRLGRVTGPREQFDSNQL